MRFTVLSAAAIVGASGAALSADPMHFTNVTSTNVVQTIAETTTNEKAIDLGDFDNDGDLDVLIGIALSDFGAKVNKLYRNDNGVLNEITGSITGSAAFITPKVTRVAFLRDYDGDGWLDIYVINDSNSHADQLFMNQHPGGVFTGYQEVFGLPNNGILGASCSGVSADFNLDGDYDVYLGNYPNNSADRMIFNNGAAAFTDVTAGNVPIPGGYVVDVAAGDFNGDSKVDMVITNDGSSGAYVIYNNINNAGSGDGDYAYPNSTTQIGNSPVENAFEPGDFNGDGRLDLYWANSNSANLDRILLNTGNDATGRAVWSFLPTSVLPPSVTNFGNRKVTVGDLNKDGRVDVLVMKEGGGNTRPTILRNTSVNGEVSFVEWTEASAFPSGTTFGGWHSAFHDFNGDGDQDILIGAFVNDHLFENVSAPTFSAANLTNGVVPGVFNGSATVVTSAPGATNTFVIQGVTAGSFISAVATSTSGSDVAIEVLSGATTLGTSDRGGAGVEEALQVNGLPAGAITVRVDTGVVADFNGDSVVNGADLASMLSGWGPVNGKTANLDLTGDGVVNGADLATLLSNWGASSGGDFTLELLARN